MELYQLKTFAMVAEEGNLTRAAKRLFASQPAVSAHIKALEDELGINLFQRSPKGMMLTAAGIQVKMHADKVLTDIDELVSAARRLKSKVQGKLRIGINSEPDSLRITEFFDTMKADHPEIQTHLLQCMSGDVFEKLADDELDAGFMYGHAESDRMHIQELRQLRLIIAGPLAWQDELKNLSPEDLGRFPWIMTPAKCPFHAAAENFFEKHNIKPKQVALVDQESILKSVVKAGAGLSFLLEHDVVVSDDIADLAVWSGEEIYIPLSIVCLKRRKEEMLLETLFSTLGRVWSKVVPA